MTIYPVFYSTNADVYYAIPGKSYDDATKQIVDTSVAPAPNVTRTFDLPLGTITGKKAFGYRVGDMMVRGDGYITFFRDFISMAGPAPRLYVYDSAETKIWKNVEVVVEYMRVSENNPPSYAGLGIGVRSNHYKQTSTFLQVPTYYLKHCFDGRFMLEKERIHNQSYVKRPALNRTMGYNAWYRMTFKIIGSKLEGWLQKTSDPTVHYTFYTDTDTSWNGDPISQGVSCFIRTDAVTDFRIRKFSIREIA